jgi:SAM-dependent methyltransferase
LGLRGIPLGWLADRIKRNGIEVSDYYGTSEAYFDLTPAGRTLINSLDPLIREGIRGCVLDAGAGRLTYAPRLRQAAREVISLDRYRVKDGLNILSDLSELPLAGGSFNSVFCSQVLEHVPDPSQVLSELARILKPGGTLLLSVPHLAYLHNEPHDYYRYTEFGLKHLLGASGFEIQEIRWSGGVLSFMGHMPSTLIVNLAWGIPVIFPAVSFLNRIWSRGIAWLERKDQKRRRFALNLVVLAIKTENPINA